MIQNSKYLSFDLDNAILQSQKLKHLSKINPVLITILHLKVLNCNSNHLQSLLQTISHFLVVKASHLHTVYHIPSHLKTNLQFIQSKTGKRRGLNICFIFLLCFRNIPFYFLQVKFEHNDNILSKNIKRR